MTLGVICYDKSKVQYLTKGWGSSLDIVTRLRAERPGFDSRQEEEIFHFSVRSRPALGPMGTGGPVSGGKGDRGVKLIAHFIQCW